MDLLNFVKYRIILFAGIVITIGHLAATGIDNFLLSNYVLTVLCSVFFAGGSLGLNEVQEWKRDALMNRTKHRPIPAGRWSPKKGLIIAISFYCIGFIFSAFLNSTVVMIGVLTLLLYNGVYTGLLKTRTPLASIFGVIPGSFPLLLGYAGSGLSIFTEIPIYLFLIISIWQIPHFGALAIKYREDYKNGGYPVYPVATDVKTTLDIMGVFTVLYIVASMVLPVLFNWPPIVMLIHLGISLILSYSFFKMIGTQKIKLNTMNFFTTINLSLLGFILTPLIS